jgi:uncharacterized membrane protein
MQLLRRFWRHVAMTPWSSRRCFPDASLEAIQREVGEHERRHRGEVRFVVEAELTTAQLWANLSARARAIEVFSMLQVWNTEDNTGILIYVLLADHKVEIVADRGIQKKVGESDWAAICHAMEARFRAGRFQEGALAGVRAASELLEKHFPASADNRNELPDAPVRM